MVVSVVVLGMTGVGAGAGQSRSCPKGLLLLPRIAKLAREVIVAEPAMAAGEMLLGETLRRFLASNWRVSSLPDHQALAFRWGKAVLRKFYRPVDRNLAAQEGAISGWLSRTS